MIVNTDQTYSDVNEFWRLHAESMKKVCAGQTGDNRAPVNRIIMDEVARKTHEHCPGFNFANMDEVSGRSQTSSIGASNTTDFKAQQHTKKDVGEIVGKVSFYRDNEVATHPVEKVMGNWVKQFHETLAM